MPGTSGSHYLAIDIGTNHVNVTVGPPSGAPVATASASIDYFKPDYEDDRAVEFNPAATLALVVETAKTALADSQLTARDIEGVGVTSQRQGLVLYDLEGIAIHGSPANDRRAIIQGAEIDSNALVDVWELTGHAPGLLTAWARLKWFAANAPEVYEKTRTVSGIADWLVFELTGELFMEQAGAIESSLGLLATGEPARALAPALNLADLSLPATRPPGTLIGNLKSNHARSLGLTAKTPVVACGPDAQMGLLGLGVQLPNSVGILSGWSTSCARVTDRPLFDDTRAMWTGRHVIENRWILEGSAGDTGATYQWLLSLLYGSLSNSEIMETIDEPVGNIAPGSTGVSAFLGPSLVHKASTGLRTGGLTFPIPATESPPDRFDIVRAASESFAFGIRHNIERLNSFRGPSLSIAVGGGMMKSRSFRNIVAGVLGCEIGVAESGSTTALGVLSQVAASMGKGPTIGEYAVLRSTELTKYEPEMGDARVYEELYDAWRHKERMLEDTEF